MPLIRRPKVKWSVHNFCGKISGDIFESGGKNLKGFGGDFGFDDEYDEVEDDISELKRRRNTNRHRTDREARENRKRTGGSSSSAKKTLLLFLIILLILLLLFALGFYAVRHGVFDFSSEADMTEKFELGKDEVGLFIDGEYVDEKAKKIDGETCVSLEYARQFDDTFYYDSSEQLLLYTDHEKTREWTPENGIEYVGDEIYIPLSTLTDIISATVQSYEKPDRVWIYTEEPKELEITKNTKFRIDAAKSSEVISKLEEGDKVRLLGIGDDWQKVESGGFAGYVETDALKEEDIKKSEGTTESFELSAGAENAEAPEAIENKKAEDKGDFPYIHYDGTISLGFHQVMSEEANSGISGALAASPGINIIAPTWYSLQGNSYTSIASADYVNTAHASGVRVWGVVDNFNNSDFSIVEGTDNILSHTSVRRNLENELVLAAKEVGLDGINIDFEQLSGDTGDDFAQFIRELSLLTHRENIALSVDNYVPEAYSEHYRRDVQGEFADYVIIMGYDEFISEVGPNASIEFVTNGISKTLEDVPASRVINAIPFYSRIWKESGGNSTGMTVGMDEARSFAAKNGGKFTWNDSSGCNYSEFESGGSKYYIWLEDDSSVELKLGVASGNNLAGVAFWKLGLEDTTVWDVISRYLAGS